LGLFLPFAWMAEFNHAEKPVRSELNSSPAFNRNALDKILVPLLEGTVLNIERSPGALVAE
jgi:hypothetical protein